MSDRVALPTVSIRRVGSCAKLRCHNRLQIVIQIVEIVVVAADKIQISTAIVAAINGGIAVALIYQLIASLAGQIDDQFWHCGSIW